MPHKTGKKWSITMLATVRVGILLDLETAAQLRLRLGWAVPDEPGKSDR